MALVFYLVFKRWQFDIDTKMLFNLKIFNIEDSDKAFRKFIECLISDSYKDKAYTNVYKIDSFNGNFI